jgi:hypothetical protein
MRLLEMIALEASTLGAVAIGTMPQLTGGAAGKI